MSMSRENNEIRLDEAWLSKMEKSVADTKWKDWHMEWPTIFRVPEILKRADTEVYEPMLISLGPYHHDKPRLQAMNQIKWRYLKKFLGRNPSKGLADYLKQIKALEPRARTAYSEELKMRSNDFVQMMMLDGCFVVENIMLGQTNEEGLVDVLDSFTITGMFRSMVAQDMLILENQLPFFLLQTLFDSAFPHQFGRLIGLTLKFIGFMFGSMKIPCHIDSFHHILHLVHSCITPAKYRDASESSTSHSHNVNRMQSSSSSESEFHWCFFSSWMNKLCGFGELIDQPTPIPRIPSATQLREAGVTFKRNLAASSFLDITFQNGELEIPLVVVDERTHTLFRNLIAFEQCFVKANRHLGSYALFMDSIIDTAADVALLQQDGILVSGLGDSKEVALLFNKLGKDVGLNRDFYLKSIFEDVNRHCGTIRNKWRARLNHDYFTNPWAMISLFAAIFLFLLTATQTIYTVLGYVQPPK